MRSTMIPDKEKSGLPFYRILLLGVSLWLIGGSILCLTERLFVLIGFPSSWDYRFVRNGMRLTDRMTYLINPHRFPKSKYWFQHAGILRREYLSVFDYPEKHVEALSRVRPDMLYGYSSNLTLLAMLIKEKGVYNAGVS